MGVVRQKRRHMRPLSEFLDYRQFLGEFCEFQEETSSTFSRAALAESIGMDADLLEGVLGRREHLPDRALPKILEILGLQGFQAEYFDLLVRYGRWTEGREIDGWFGPSVR